MFNTFWEVKRVNSLYFQQQNIEVTRGDIFIDASRLILSIAVRLLVDIFKVMIRKINFEIVLANIDAYMHNITRE